MKKSFSLLLIFVITAVSLCSCAMFGNTNLMRGTITDNTYTNTSLGITLTLPDGWRFYSTSEIASVMNITKEILEDPDILDSTDITTFMDFMAVDAKETNNINMSIENLATTGNQNLSDEELLAMLQEQVQQQLKELDTAAIAADSWNTYGEVVLADSMDEAIDLANRYAPEHLEGLDESLCAYDLVVNTAPARVLDAARLAQLEPDCLVIDLASRPGGVDMEAAARLGVRVIWALSLPGKVAPVTAGRILRDTICHILCELGV